MGWKLCVNGLHSELICILQTANILTNKDKMVGETGFEPATLCSQNRCATRLRYSPTGSSLVSWVLYTA